MDASHPEAPLLAERAGRPPPYRSPALLGRLVVYSLVLVICLWVLDFVWAFDIWERVAEAKEWERRTGQEVQWQSFGGESAMGAGLDVLSVVVPLLFIAFLWRAYRNLQALGIRRLRFGDGWVVAGWLIPVIALFRPKQIANDIWRGSDPEAPRAQDDSWSARQVPRLFDWWWAVWVLAAWVIGPADWLNHGADTTDEIAFSMLLEDAAMVAFCTAAVLASVVVVRLSRRQEARAVRLGLR